MTWIMHSALLYNFKNHLFCKFTWKTSLLTSGSSCTTDSWPVSLVVSTVGKETI